MDVSSTSDDEITLLCTWALTVTHVACEYTEQKFNAEKTGGDQVIPSPNLDTDLVMACDRLVDQLIKAYKNPKARLLERCPPGHEGTKLIDIPATILDASSAIIAWYLPDTLTDATQKEIWAALDLLAPILEKSVKLDGNWRTNQKWFTPRSQNDVLTPGCINLSLAWFQQGHKNQVDPAVSASLNGASLEDILKAIARPAAIATAALRVMHPEQYWAGLRAFASLEEKAQSKELLKMSETLQYWATVFNSLSVICNQETPNHRDHSSIPECFDILTRVGNYSNARMSMPSLQLEFRKDCQTRGSCSGRGSDCLGMDSVVWMGKVGLEEVEKISGTPYL
ncbi:uncharacterized protein EDB91DRAFT_1087731 [Suillus paluster]|uniref:uncharacterized protein n=1 Tax=Suillus paluster TaxID=48578 RepID=UPI001B85C8B1|nr:uncharacterized protein EDB91DRAFT_1087731 [Suillus paluster]KAG1723659.1 hypothetical protein EDB91DRAFT_1087731 [Suillus paluster]